ncbi:hypothetical protein IJ076_01870 [Candidatus Saccharibacteria bacterium]|nr:hypothetical protein [Candidatus Saccharibacteria bacterium]
MKTSVEKLFFYHFDWKDLSTGEPMRYYYLIQVDAPGTNHDGDLMSHRLAKLLYERGSVVADFPKILLSEIYDDCCWGYAGFMFTEGALEHLEEKSFEPHFHNYTHLTQEEWTDLADCIIKCMKLRILADVSKYLEIVTAVPTPEDFKASINSNDAVVKANEEYAASGDWILSLEDQSLMPELTLVLLGLRRGFWSAFRRNCSKFELQE